ncbi:MAG TPA: hypothetical protein VHC71_11775 [Hyphomicrobium sp.]|jgi:hypothetical protein|nr:hypothetical protein [Hyphomicrobium sp.]
MRFQNGAFRITPQRPHHDFRHGHSHQPSHRERLLEQTTGDEDDPADESARPATTNPFEDLFAANRDVPDGTDETDDADGIYQLGPPKAKPPTVTMLSGRVVEGLADGGGDVTDSL